MSTEDDKIKHSSRIQQKNSHISRQVRIRQSHKFPERNTLGTNSPHRYHKISGVTCGDSHCAMCGNPRKFFNDLTQQEKRLFQDLDTVRDRHSNGIPPTNE
jgi:hypothetical protein